jgi:dihydroorotase-like cyclic amidohydrolase
MDYSSFLRHSQRYSLSKERVNIATICRIAGKHPSVPVLIAPISSPSVLPQTCPANVSFGTAVPYLAFSFPDLVKPEDPVWKSIPPIRDTETRGNLQNCVLSATSLLTIASFHQSQRLSDKYLCAFNQAEDGLMTLGYGLQGIWTSLRGKNAVEDEDLLLLLADYLATKPAQWLGLQRGRIEAGYAGDILIWDPWAAVEAESDPLSPYAGMRLLGRVCEVYLRGSLVYSQGGAALITGHLSS